MLCRCEHVVLVCAGSGRYRKPGDVVEWPVYGPALFEAGLHCYRWKVNGDKSWGEDKEAFFHIFSEPDCSECCHLIVEFWNKRKKQTKFSHLQLANKFLLSKSQSGPLWRKPDDNSYYHPTLPHWHPWQLFKEAKQLWKVETCSQGQPCDGTGVQHIETAETSRVGSGKE